ncbi:phosphonate C-P lyase system protein PhnH [Paenibacillus pectinilyticus]|uniref:Phosphonate C-P lyase system protein PhnH n=1 Tax=Paenibacillus pectinilyticus TaxID=512399 RepID=A0A1C0ZVV5_9BACL|nr:phosphonate C-P lyase system protein PhnH [Paenibacillus pectinilyticus]OCT12241.1 phosphonate C-P lyase system protein PhnH [Paenibacillus pectinilyticus]
MSLDLIHDIQSAYRKLIDSLSRPGTVSDLSAEAGKLGMDQGCLPSTQVLAAMLLDPEVSFTVFSERKAQVTHVFKQMSYAREVDASEADFIFVLGDAPSEDLTRALEIAKIGDLQDPHFSATLIIETESLSNGTKLRLSGPGIQSSSNAKVTINDAWLDIRAARNCEYPLGLDIIFVDAAHRLLALPRTTQVLVEEVS